MAIILRNLSHQTEMVCQKCTHKLSKLATVHVDSYKSTKATSSSINNSSRVTNENKLLSSKQKFKPTTEEFKKCRWNS